MLKMRRTCRLVTQSRSVQYYRSVNPRHDLRVRMREQIPKSSDPSFGSAVSQLMAQQRIYGRCASGT